MKIDGLFKHYSGHTINLRKRHYSLERAVTLIDTRFVTLFSISRDYFFPHTPNENDEKRFEFLTGENVSRD